MAVLKNPAYHFKRIGLEAGPLSQWLFSALAEAELPVVCVETRHMQAVLKAQINKTDRNDARFRKSKSVGAVFGLTCSKYQSGAIDRSGRISRCGDEMMRVMLYEAAQSMLRSKKWSWLKAWAMKTVQDQIRRRKLELHPAVE